MQTKIFCEIKWEDLDKKQMDVTKKLKAIQEEYLQLFLDKNWYTAHANDKEKQACRSGF